jgi:hypothetical protein
VRCGCGDALYAWATARGGRDAVATMFSVSRTCDWAELARGLQLSHDDF